MKPNYHTVRHDFTGFDTEIAIKNFGSSNVYLELPIVHRFESIFDKYLVGIWKIKKLKV